MRKGISSQQQLELLSSVIFLPCVLVPQNYDENSKQTDTEVTFSSSGVICFSTISLWLISPISGFNNFVWTKESAERSNCFNPKQPWPKTKVPFYFEREAILEQTVIHAWWGLWFPLLLVTPITSQVTSQNVTMVPPPHPGEISPLHSCITPRLTCHPKTDVTPCMVMWLQRSTLAFLAKSLVYSSLQMVPLGGVQLKRI